MALFLNEQEVAQLLPMDECIEALDRAFAHAGAGQADNKARSRIRMPGRLLSTSWRRPTAGKGCSDTRLIRPSPGRAAPR